MLGASWRALFYVLAIIVVSSPLQIFAEGSTAGKMCTGVAEQYTCNYPQKIEKKDATGRVMRTIVCMKNYPCQDVTAKDVAAKGVCLAPGKCSATQCDGTTCQKPDGVPTDGGVPGQTPSSPLDNPALFTDPKSLPPPPPAITTQGILNSFSDQSPSEPGDSNSPTGKSILEQLFGTPNPEQVVEPTRTPDSYFYGGDVGSLQSGGTNPDGSPQNTNLDPFPFESTFGNPAGDAINAMKDQGVSIADAVREYAQKAATALREGIDYFLSDDYGYGNPLQTESNEKILTDDYNRLVDRANLFQDLQQDRDLAYEEYVKEFNACKNDSCKKRVQNLQNEFRAAQQRYEDLFKGQQPVDLDTLRNGVMAGEAPSAIAGGKTEPPITPEVLPSLQSKAPEVALGDNDTAAEVQKKLSDLGGYMQDQLPKEVNDRLKDIQTTSTLNPDDPSKPLIYTANSEAAKELNKVMADYNETNRVARELGRELQLADTVYQRAEMEQGINKSIQDAQAEAMRGTLTGVDPTPPAVVPCGDGQSCTSTQLAQEKVRQLERLESGLRTSNQELIQDAQQRIRAAENLGKELVAIEQSRIREAPVGAQLPYEGSRAGITGGSISDPTAGSREQALAAASAFGRPDLVADPQAPLKDQQTLANDAAARLAALGNTYTDLNDKWGIINRVGDKSVPAPFAPEVAQLQSDMQNLKEVSQYNSKVFTSSLADFQAQTMAENLQKNLDAAQEYYSRPPSENRGPEPTPPAAVACGNGQTCTSTQLAQEKIGHLRDLARSIREGDAAGIERARTEIQRLEKLGADVIALDRQRIEEAPRGGQLPFEGSRETLGTGERRVHDGDLGRAIAAAEATGREDLLSNKSLPIGEQLSLAREAQARVAALGNTYQDMMDKWGVVNPDGTASLPQSIAKEAIPLVNDIRSFKDIAEYNGKVFSESMFEAQQKLVEKMPEAVPIDRNQDGATSHQICDSYGYGDSCAAFPSRSQRDLYYSTLRQDAVDRETLQNNPGKIVRGEIAANIGTAEVAAARARMETNASIRDHIDKQREYAEGMAAKLNDPNTPASERQAIVQMVKDLSARDAQVQNLNEAYRRIDEFTSGAGKDRESWEFATGKKELTEQLIATQDQYYTSLNRLGELTGAKELSEDTQRLLNAYSGNACQGTWCKFSDWWSGVAQGAAETLNQNSFLRNWLSEELQFSTFALQFSDSAVRSASIAFGDPSNAAIIDSYQLDAFEQARSRPIAIAETALNALPVAVGALKAANLAGSGISALLAPYRVETALATSAEFQFSRTLAAVDSGSLVKTYNAATEALPGARTAAEADSMVSLQRTILRDAGVGLNATDDFVNLRSGQVVAVKNADGMYVAANSPEAATILEARNIPPALTDSATSRLLNFETGILRGTLQAPLALAEVTAAGAARTVAGAFDTLATGAERLGATAVGQTLRNLGTDAAIAVRMPTEAVTGSLARAIDAALPDEARPIGTTRYDITSPISSQIAREIEVNPQSAAQSLARVDSEIQRLERRIDSMQTYVNFERGIAATPEVRAQLEAGIRQARSEIDTLRPLQRNLNELVESTSRPSQLNLALEGGVMKTAPQSFRELEYELSRSLNPARPQTPLSVVPQQLQMFPQIWEGANALSSLARFSDLPPVRAIRAVAPIVIVDSNAIAGVTQGFKNINTAVQEVSSASRAIADRTAELYSGARNLSESVPGSQTIARLTDTPGLTTPTPYQQALRIALNGSPLSISGGIISLPPSIQQMNQSLESIANSAPLPASDIATVDLSTIAIQNVDPVSAPLAGTGGPQGETTGSNAPVAGETPSVPTPRVETQLTEAGEIPSEGTPAYTTFQNTPRGVTVWSNIRNAANFLNYFETAVNPGNSIPKVILHQIQSPTPQPSGELIKTGSTNPAPTYSAESPRPLLARDAVEKMLEAGPVSEAVVPSFQPSNFLFGPATQPKELLALPEAERAAKITEAIKKGEEVLNTLWKQRFAEIGKEFTPPTVVPGAWFGGDRYLVTQNSIQFNVTATHYLKFGTEAALAALAHEYGHAVQTQLGVVPTNQNLREYEMQADYIAGTSLKPLFEQGILNPGDEEYIYYSRAYQGRDLHNERFSVRSTLSEWVGKEVTATGNGLASARVRADLITQGMRSNEWNREVIAEDGTKIAPLARQRFGSIAPPNVVIVEGGPLAATLPARLALRGADLLNQISPSAINQRISSALSNIGIDTAIKTLQQAPRYVWESIVSPSQAAVPTNKVTVSPTDSNVGTRASQAPGTDQFYTGRRISPAQAEKYIGEIYDTKEASTFNDYMCPTGPCNHSVPGIAHPNLPLGSLVDVCNLNNGLCGRMVVMDTGPAAYTKRTIDLNPTAQRILGTKSTDLVPARYRVVSVPGIEKKVTEEAQTLLQGITPAPGIPNTSIVQNASRPTGMPGGVALNATAPASAPSPQTPQVAQTPTQQPVRPVALPKEHKANSIVDAVRDRLKKAVTPAQAPEPVVTEAVQPTPAPRVLDSATEGNPARSGIEESFVFGAKPGNEVLVAVPKNLDPNKPIIRVVYFHGDLEGSSERGVTAFQRTVERQQLVEQLQASGVNAVLVAPMMGMGAASSVRGLSTADGLRAFMAEANQKFAEYSGIPIANFEKGPIIVSGYSGGYMAVGKVLSTNAFGDQLAGVLLLDAGYGTAGMLPAAANWITTNPNKILVSAYTKSTALGNNQLLEHLKGNEKLSTSPLPANKLIPPGTLAVFETKGAAAQPHRNFVTEAGLTTAGVDRPLEVFLRNFPEMKVAETPLLPTDKFVTRTLKAVGKLPAKAVIAVRTLTEKINPTKPNVPTVLDETQVMINAALEEGKKAGKIPSDLVVGKQPDGSFKGTSAASPDTTFKVTLTRSTSARYNQDQWNFVKDFNDATRLYSQDDYQKFSAELQSSQGIKLLDWERLPKVVHELIGNQIGPGRNVVGLSKEAILKQSTLIQALEDVSGVQLYIFPSMVRPSPRWTPSMHSDLNKVQTGMFTAMDIALPPNLQESAVRLANSLGIRGINIYPNTYLNPYNGRSEWKQLHVDMGPRWIGTGAAGASDATLRSLARQHLSGAQLGLPEQFAKYLSGEVTPAFGTGEYTVSFAATKPVAERGIVSVAAAQPDFVFSGKITPKADVKQPGPAAKIGNAVDKVKTVMARVTDSVQDRVASVTKPAPQTPAIPTVTVAEVPKVLADSGLVKAGAQASRNPDGSIAIRTPEGQDLTLKQVTQPGEQVITLDPKKYLTWAEFYKLAPDKEAVIKSAYQNGINQARKDGRFNPQIIAGLVGALEEFHAAYGYYPGITSAYRNWGSTDTHQTGNAFDFGFPRFRDYKGDNTASPHILAFREMLLKRGVHVFPEPNATGGAHDHVYTSRAPWPGTLPYKKGTETTNVTVRTDSQYALFGADGQQIGTSLAIQIADTQTATPQIALRDPIPPDMYLTGVVRRPHVVLPKVLPGEWELYEQITSFTHALELPKTYWIPTTPPDAFMPVQVPRITLAQTPDAYLPPQTPGITLGQTPDAFLPTQTPGIALGQTPDAYLPTVIPGTSVPTAAVRKPISPEATEKAITATPEVVIQVRNVQLEDALRNAEAVMAEAKKSRDALMKDGRALENLEKSFANLYASANNLANTLEKFWVQGQKINAGTLNAELNAMSRNKNAFNKLFDSILAQSALDAEQLQAMQANKNALNKIADELLRKRNDLVEAAGYDFATVKSFGGARAEEAIKAAPGQIKTVRSSLSKFTTALNAQKDITEEQLSVASREYYESQTNYAIAKEELARAPKIAMVRSEAIRAPAPALNTDTPDAWYVTDTKRAGEPVITDAEQPKPAPVQLNERHSAADALPADLATILARAETLRNPGDAVPLKPGDITKQIFERTATLPIPPVVIPGMIDDILTITQNVQSRITNTPVSTSVGTVFAPTVQSLRTALGNSLDALSSVSRLAPITLHIRDSLVRFGVAERSTSIPLETARGQNNFVRGLSGSDTAIGNSLRYTVPGIIVALFVDPREEERNGMTPESAEYVPSVVHALPDASKRDVTLVAIATSSVASLPRWNVDISTLRDGSKQIPKETGSATAPPDDAPEQTPPSEPEKKPDNRETDAQKNLKDGIAEYNRLKNPEDPTASAIMCKDNATICGFRVGSETHMIDTPQGKDLGTIFCRGAADANACYSSALTAARTAQGGSITAPPSGPGTPGTPPGQPSGPGTVPTGPSVQPDGSDASQGFGGLGGILNSLMQLVRGLFTNPNANSTPSTQQQQPTNATTSSGPLPTISLSATPNRIAAGGTAVLNWSAQNAVSCSVYGPGNTPVGSGTTGSATSTALTRSTVIGIACVGNGGVSTSRTTVSVEGDSEDPIPVVLPSQAELQSAFNVLRSTGSLNSVSGSNAISGTGGGTGGSSGQNGNNEAPVTPPNSGVDAYGKKVSPFCDPTQPIGTFIQCLCSIEPTGNGCKPWQK